jgi:hypothetical protein
MHKPYSKWPTQTALVSDDYTTIRVSKETKERLEDYGEMGMSYDDVIQHVLDLLDNQKEEENE